MARNLPVVLVLACALGAWSAETVTGLSAPFSFPSATATVRQVQLSLPATLACQVLPGGAVSVRWSLGDASAVGSIRFTGLDGRLVAVRSVKGVAGSIALPQLPSGVYLVTMTASGAVRTVRAAVSR
jgi:hypothetical protein